MAFGILLYFTNHTFFKSVFHRSMFVTNVTMTLLDNVAIIL